MFLGLAYTCLAIASISLWAIGFNPPCPLGTCYGYYEFLTRPLTLWGTSYYLLSAYLCYTGMAQSHRRLTLVIIGGGVLVHSGLLTSFWAYTKNLCYLCAIFLILETTLFLAIVLVSPKRGRVRLLPGTMAALFLGSVFLLVLNPAPPFRLYDSDLTIPLEFLSGTELKVSTADGLLVTLDLRNKPALIWSLWCPHCRKELERVARYPPAMRPYLVLALRMNTKELDAARALLTQLGLSNERIYVVAASKVGVTPLMLFWDSKTNTVRIK
ncbi:hypothetical protein SAMN00808754_2778 [Thermanaeromonas toyohensis ToBE]|uniref:Vitamin K epoxide reductase family protein n=1 Tax=Thermanaeromonas toyohensis ToBE TaxID=698762 RepID=A0A1W1W0M2_9FIRM|nr:hypothetical protein SAMN00808754_2778 [Thermanaeromonas toyohensis ToBE]